MDRCEYQGSSQRGEASLDVSSNDQASSINCQFEVEVTMAFEILPKNCLPPSHKFAYPRDYNSPDANHQKPAPNPHICTPK